jgi:hypothetical protein
MNDPAASGWGIRQGFSFKSRGKPRGIKPTGGIKYSSSFQVSTQGLTADVGEYLSKAIYTKFHFARKGITIKT